MATSSGPTPARVTLADVAAAAGVATSTASDALNQRGRMAEATRERVHEKARELGYLPNPSARGPTRWTIAAARRRIADVPRCARHVSARPLLQPTHHRWQHRPQWDAATRSRSCRRTTSTSPASCRLLHSSSPTATSRVKPSSGRMRSAFPSSPICATVTTERPRSSTSTTPTQSRSPTTISLRTAPRESDSLPTSRATRRTPTTGKSTMPCGALKRRRTASSAEQAAVTSKLLTLAVNELVEAGCDAIVLIPTGAGPEAIEILAKMGKRVPERRARARRR